MNKKEQIKLIMEILDKGFTVAINEGQIWECKSRNPKDNRTYLFYRHFGQSAVRRTLTDLTWLLNTIFKQKYNRKTEDEVYKFSVVNSNNLAMANFKTEKAAKNYIDFQNGKRYKISEN